MKPSGQAQGISLRQFGSVSDARTRISRLYDGRKKLSQSTAQNILAKRLFLLLVSNEVEFVCGIDKLEPAHGERRKSRALRQVAQDSNVEPKTIKSDAKRSKRYFEYLEKAGPGSLLELGEEVAHL